MYIIYIYIFVYMYYIYHISGKCARVTILPLLWMRSLLCGKSLRQLEIWHHGKCIPSGKLTTCYWKWTCCSLIYLRNMVIFHSYVSLPKGKWWNGWMNQWCVMICIDGNWSCREISSFDLAAADQTQLNFRDCYPKPLWGWTAKSKRSK